VDLVVLSEVRWSYFRTRKQFLLSRFPEPWRVFFAQPPAAGGGDPWRPRREGNVTTFTVPFLKPGTTHPLYNRLMGWGPARAAVEWVAERALRTRLEQLGVEPRPVLMASNIYAARALSRLPRKLLFYDFNDSPFQFAASPGWARDYWRRTVAQVDVFFVVSEYYRRQLAGETDRPLVVIGNGVETEHFQAPRPVPVELERLPRPLVGYVGLLSHFLDFETLEALRRGRGGGTLVLIGPDTSATRDRLRELAAREGVAVLGPRPYEEIPAYMQALDVGVIPFRAHDPFVRGINPNKVYQYLAAGIPVVTTPVLDLEPSFPDLVFATDAASMAREVGRVLEAPRDAERARALARPLDWSVLARRMIGEMERRLAAVS
jgi:glycosyltransferase involved in cell wall biosynthesis